MVKVARGDGRMFGWEGSNDRYYSLVGGKMVEGAKTRLLGWGAVEVAQGDGRMFGFIFRRNTYMGRSHRVGSHHINKVRW